MMEENRAEQLFFLWEKISEGEIRLLRVFGEQPVVTVPGFIDGRCVRELGDYCFSRRKLPENEIRRMRSGIQGTAEVCGRAVCLC